LLFIKGLEMYGKGWKKIAGLIKTRTVVQIRTHAQKYFLKLTKARQHVDSGGGISLDGKSLGGVNRKVSIYLLIFVILLKILRFQCSV
jgi:SHAQKYF class myb-like DNA-binding protein